MDLIKTKKGSGLLVRSRRDRGKEGTWWRSTYTYLMYHSDLVQSIIDIEGGVHKYINFSANKDKAHQCRQ